MKILRVCVVGGVGWGSIHFKVTFRSITFHRHPHHSRTCLGFSRLFGTSFAYNIDFAFVGWGWRVGGLVGGLSIVW